MKRERHLESEIACLSFGDRGEIHKPFHVVGLVILHGLFALLYVSYLFRGLSLHRRRNCGGITDVTTVETGEYGLKRLAGHTFQCIDVVTGGVLGTARDEQVNVIVHDLN